MSHVLRVTVYLCRAWACKRQNRVYEYVDSDNGVLVSPVAWQHRCGGCGRGSFDMQFQKLLAPPNKQAPFSPAALRDKRRF